jgi:hypothetical protein
MNPMVFFLAYISYFVDKSMAKAFLEVRNTLINMYEVRT